MQTITGDKTFVPVGLTIAILMASIGATWGLSSWTSRLSVAEVKVSSLETSRAELLLELKSTNEKLTETNKTLAEILGLLDRKPKR